MILVLIAIVSMYLLIFILAVVPQTNLKEKLEFIGAFV